MSGGSLSSRVKNMKFMQVAGDKQRKETSAAAEKDGLKKLKDSSEWTLPVSTRTLKVIKSKNKRVRKVGFSKINSIGSVIVSQNLENGNIGRMKLSNTTTEKPEGENRVLAIPSKGEESLSPDLENGKKITTKKQKKSKKRSKVIDEFNNKSEEEFDPTEVDLTSKSLLDLWKLNKK